MNESASHKESLDKYYQSYEINSFWEEKYPKHLRLYARKYQIRNKFIDKYLIGGKILDIGCGLGDLLKLASKKADISVGIELSESQIKQAKANLITSGIQNVELVLSLAEKLPFKDKIFDCIILADVIEHLLDTEACLSEIKRVSKKNLRLILTTPRKSIESTWKLIDSFLLFPFEVLKKILRKNQRFPLIREIKDEHLSPSELKKILIDNGFEIEKHYFIEFYPGSEGGGFFGRIVLKGIYKIPLADKMTDLFFETVFSAIEKIKIFNTRQIVVARGEYEIR